MTLTPDDEHPGLYDNQHGAQVNQDVERSDDVLVGSVDCILM